MGMRVDRPQMCNDLLLRIAIHLFERTRGLITLARTQIGHAETDQGIVVVGHALLHSGLDEAERVGEPALAPSVFAQLDQCIAVRCRVGRSQSLGVSGGVGHCLAFRHVQKTRRAVAGQDFGTDTLLSCLRFRRKTEL